MLDMDSDITKSLCGSLFHHGILQRNYRRSVFATFWFIRVHLKAINWASPPFKKDNLFIMEFYKGIIGK